MNAISNNIIQGENKLEIELTPNKKKYKFRTNEKIPIILKVKNNDTSLTEKIIKYNIDFKNLKYKLVITQMDILDNVVRCKLLNKYYSNTIDYINYYDYSPKDLNIVLDTFDSMYLYKIQVFLIEKILGSKIENQMLYSLPVFMNPFYGVVTQRKIENLYNERYKPKQFLSKSEKDNMKVVNNEINLKGLHSIIDHKDVKEFTYEGRNYDNMKQFVESKNKASKLMTEKRKKKLLFSTETELFFINKCEIENNTKNPFLKNEWFMGPVYSYDYNYFKYK
ncbi:MAG: hypothetical protein MJ252_00465 [archaeon]|nr:hypothetical protein [archaeon]